MDDTRLTVTKVTAVQFVKKKKLRNGLNGFSRGIREWSAVDNMDSS